VCSTVTDVDIMPSCERSQVSRQAISKDNVKREARRVWRSEWRYFFSPSTATEIERHAARRELTELEYIVESVHVMLSTELTEEMESKLK